MSSSKKKGNHEWTDFEKHTLCCLLAKGMHHQVRIDNGKEENFVKPRYRSYLDRSESNNVYLNIATALNQAINNNGYDYDIDKREVSQMIDQMLVDYKGILGPSGYLERQATPRMTRGLKRVLRRSPPINFNGTTGEWLLGRKDSEMARYPGIQPPFSKPTPKPQNIEAGVASPRNDSNLAAGQQDANEGAVDVAVRSGNVPFQSDSGQFSGTLTDISLHSTSTSTAVAHGGVYRPIYVSSITTQKSTINQYSQTGGGYLDSSGVPIASPAAPQVKVSFAEGDSGVNGFKFAAPVGRSFKRPGTPRSILRTHQHSGPASTSNTTRRRANSTDHTNSVFPQYMSSPSNTDGADQAASTSASASASASIMQYYAPTPYTFTSHGASNSYEQSDNGFASAFVSGQNHRNNDDDVHMAEAGKIAAGGKRKSVGWTNDMGGN